MKPAQLEQPQSATEVSDEPHSKKETVAALVRERRVFERIEGAGKWTALALVLLALVHVLWTWFEGGLPALRALVFGK